ncbi:hypothetical protein T484DRAFT_1937013 [Baffinella frigidus]|nr:hypothetical protein T484DRAFT_1937013 [Cryptophyta sp. CCMP2293]
MPADTQVVSCPRCTSVTNRTDPRANTAAPPSSQPQPRQDAGALSGDAQLEEAIRRSLMAPGAPATMQHGGAPSPAEGAALDDLGKARALTTVCDVTGCDADTATACLEANGWMVEAAVEAYVEHKRVRSTMPNGSGGAPSGEKPPTTTPLPSPAPGGGGGGGAGLGLRDGGAPPGGGRWGALAAQGQKPPPPSTPPPPPPTPPPGASINGDGGAGGGGWSGGSGFTASAPGGTVPQAGTTSSPGGSVPGVIESLGGMHVVETPGQETIEWKGLPHFLASLGLEKYSSVLAAQEISDPAGLVDLTDEDMKEMHVSTIGARRKLLAATKRLKEARVVVVPDQDADLADLLS